jgi:arylsulfatase A-like enzyme
MKAPRSCLLFTAGFSIGLAAAAFSGYACRSAEAERDTGLFRVIDHISEANVVKSPLRNPDPKNASLAEIAEVDVLQDLGTGPNPFLIKRKLHVGPAYLNSLMAIPPTEIKFDLKVPENARMEFSYGIRFDKGLNGVEGKSRETTFSVVLSFSGRESEVFSKSLTLGARKAMEFSNRTIDLGEYAGKDVAFRLITEGDDQALAFWLNPVVYRVREDARYVILVSLDTLRPDHLGGYGYFRDTSPNMDALAKDGIRYSNVMASAPWTLPSHMSLMTGLNSVNHGVVAPTLRLNPLTPTLAELLKTRGFYNVALTGGVLVSGFFGFNRGFESYRVISDSGNRDAAEALGRTAGKWIENNRDKSFFLFLHTYQIHDPFNPAPPANRRYLAEGAAMDVFSSREMKLCYEKRYTPLPAEVRQNIIDLYDAEIRYTDEMLIGPLVARLKSLGIYDRTMIVLTSDHGEEFFDHRGWIHTHSVYNEVLRIPLIIKHFGSRGAGKIVETYVRNVDVMPTICRELGIGIKSDSIDGSGLQGLEKGGASEGAGSRIAVGDLSVRLAFRYVPPKIAVLRFPFKFIFNAPYEPEDLAYYFSPPPPLVETELYDLSRDPAETVNLAGERKDLVREFRELMKKLYTPRKRKGAEKSATDPELEKQLKTLGYL